VADSAVTCEESIGGRKGCYVLNGVRKLQPIPYLRAGLSMWGLGTIPATGRYVSTDVWADDFIRRHSSVGGLGDFASALLKELVSNEHEIRDPIGFHLAGYVPVGDRMLPTLYHVRNVDGDYEHYDMHPFVLGHDIPPQEIGDIPLFRRNGDYGPYAVLEETTRHFLPIIKAKMGLDIPHPSLRGRVAYHCGWVRFVSDLYESASLLRTIGGRVSALSIDSRGNMDFHQMVG